VWGVGLNAANADFGETEPPPSLRRRTRDTTTYQAAERRVASAARAVFLMETVPTARPEAAEELGNPGGLLRFRSRAFAVDRRGCRFHASILQSLDLLRSEFELVDGSEERRSSARSAHALRVKVKRKRTLIAPRTTRPHIGFHVAAPGWSESRIN